MKLSAEACNGVILMPGEEFSYNNTTGSRSADRAISRSRLLGGASVDKRRRHLPDLLHHLLRRPPPPWRSWSATPTLRGLRPDGMDATVYFGLSDFAKTTPTTR
ncbi:MAG: hypothetical protein ACLTYN_14790 [Dysosmobacter welbionis]